MIKMSVRQAEMMDRIMQVTIVKPPIIRHNMLDVSQLSEQERYSLSVVVRYAASGLHYRRMCEVQSNLARKIEATSGS